MATRIIRGAAGIAERFTKIEPETPAQQATLAGWLINAPGQSPAWSHYLLSLIHLRPIDGAKPANIRIPGATHEIIVCALDPEKHPTVNVVESLCPLLPINAEAQFQVETDEQAIDLAEKCVTAVCNGFLPAEPPFQDYGRRMWQESVTASAEHARTGGHLSGRRN